MKNYYNLKIHFYELTKEKKAVYRITFDMMRAESCRKWWFIRNRDIKKYGLYEKQE